MYIEEIGDDKEKKSLIDILTAGKSIPLKLSVDDDLRQLIFVVLSGLSVTVIFSVFIYSFLRFKR